MKNIALLAFCMVLIAHSTFGQGSDALKSIFNGKDFEGWVLPDDNLWWKVEGGVLVAKSGPEQKGSILWTSAHYRDFIFQADFKMGDGTVDSGIFMRKDHDQIQIGQSGSLKRDMTCSPYIPGKGYPVEANGVADLLDEKGWNTIKIKAVGNTYTTWLNGQEVMEYVSETAVDEGPIGIQLHPNREMSIEYRNILVAEVN